MSTAARLIVRTGILSLATTTAFAVLALGFTAPAFSVASAAADATFNTNVSTTLSTGNANALVVQPDGKILVGGVFTQRLVRFNADGSIDTSFNASAYGALVGASGVKTLALQPDGKILAGSTVNNSTSRLKRLNADGTIDNTFSTDIPGGVFDIALQPNGQVLVAGSWLNPSSQLGNNRSFARFDSNGAPDTTFNANVSDALGTLNGARTVVALPNGKVLVGGGNWSPLKHLALFASDGTPDATYNSQASSFFNAVGAEVSDLTVQQDGKILIAGIFTTVGGVASKAFTRLNADGSIDTDFRDALGTSISKSSGSPSATSALVQSDGKILVGGSFDGPTAWLTRLNESGSPDTTFSTELPSSGLNSVVNALGLQPDGGLIAAGYFVTPGIKLARFTGLATPALVSSVSPTSGGIAGGTAITITGNYFASNATVMIGGQPATNVVVVSSTQITAVTPAGAAGAADITVTNPSAPVGTGAALFTYAAGGSDSSGGSNTNGGGSNGGGGATTDPLGPITPETNSNLKPGGLGEGDVLLLVNGVPTPANVKPKPKKNPVKLIVSTADMSMGLEGRGDEEDPLGLSPKQALNLQSGNKTRAKTRAKVQPTALSQGAGFKANSDVKFYILPDIYVGKLVTDASGAYSGTLNIPPGIAPGVHTMQANGYAPNGDVRSMNLGVRVKPRTSNNDQRKQVSFRLQFGNTKAKLTKASKTQLRDVVGRTGTDVTKVVVHGYVQQYGSDANDSALSKARAKNVAAFLRSIGVNGRFATKGAGIAGSKISARKAVVTITFRD